MPYDLDHVALAAHDTAPVLRFLVGELGGTVLFGGQSVGFRPMQVRVGDGRRGMTVELLEPWETGRDDFLARFLDRRGPGPHHLTFKVPELAPAVQRAREGGFEVVGVDTSDPEWQEAFLLPREAHGTVVQLAHHAAPLDREALVAWAREHDVEGSPRWWSDPPPRATRTCFLRRVVVGSPSVPATTSFYAAHLGGAESDAGAGFTELTWPGGACVRVERRAGPPGIDRLEVEGLSAERELLGTRFVPAA